MNQKILTEEDWLDTYQDDIQVDFKTRIKEMELLEVLELSPDDIVDDAIVDDAIHALWDAFIAQQYRLYVAYNECN